jgi:hypothetical protein
MPDERIPSSAPASSVWRSQYVTATTEKWRRSVRVTRLRMRSWPKHAPIERNDAIWSGTCVPFDGRGEEGSERGAFV